MSFTEALDDPDWKVAMDEKMAALLSRGIWKLVDPPTGSDIVGYKWVFTIKYKPNGIVDRNKARLIAKELN